MTVCEPDVLGALCVGGSTNFESGTGEKSRVCKLFHLDTRSERCHSQGWSCWSCRPKQEASCGLVRTGGNASTFRHLTQRGGRSKQGETDRGGGAMKPFTTIRFSAVVRCMLVLAVLIVPQAVQAAAWEAVAGAQSTNEGI